MSWQNFLQTAGGAVGNFIGNMFGFGLGGQIGGSLLGALGGSYIDNQLTGTSGGSETSGGSSGTSTFGQTSTQEQGYGASLTQGYTQGSSGSAYGNLYSNFMGTPTGTSQLATFLGNIFGATLANKEQQATQNAVMAYNAAEAQKNRDYQTYMSNTSYQRAVKDMQAAGINPILAAQNGGASTPTGATGSASALTSHAASAGNAMYQYGNNKAQILAYAEEKMATAKELRMESAENMWAKVLTSVFKQDAQSWYNGWKEYEDWEAKTEHQKKQTSDLQGSITGTASANFGQQQNYGSNNSSNFGTKSRWVNDY